MKIVGTVGAKTYLAESMVEEGEKVLLHAAFAFANFESHTGTEIARHYIRGRIVGKVADVEVTRANIVTSQDADEIGPLVELMMKYLPIAEKQARANAVLPELDAVMRATAPTAPAPKAGV